MRFTSLLLPGVAALLQKEANVSPMSQVVKLLEDTLADLLDERTNTEAAYKKMDCLTKKTVEANNKLIEENNASIDQMKEELALMDHMPLTDEAQQLTAKLDAKNKEIKAAQDNLESSTEKFSAYMTELDTGVAALGAAAKEIVGKDANAAMLAVKKIMASSQLSGSQKSAFAVYESQAPEAYKSQVGAIKDLIQNLQHEYSKEKIDAQQQWKKDKASQEANLQMLQSQKDSLQAEFEAGAGEAAAKMKRTQELNEATETAQAEIDAAKKESDEMTATFAVQSKDFNNFIADSAAQEDAMNQAIEVLGGDDARDQFQAVAHNEASFLQVRALNKVVLSLPVAATTPTAFLETKHSQLSKLYALMGTGSAAIQTLITAIDDMKAELNVEKDSIENSMEKCEAKSTKLLEAAKEAAEQVDGFQARINALEIAIANEQETQEKLTKEVAEQMEIRAAAIKDYNEARAE